MSDWEFIDSYSRKQAIEDGVLVDITEIAQDYGFKLSTCLSSTLFFKHFYNEEEEVEKRKFDKYLLSMFLIEVNQEIIHRGGDEDRLYVDYLGDEIVCHIGPGDKGEPVLTICYPDEL